MAEPQIQVPETDQVENGESSNTTNTVESASDNKSDAGPSACASTKKCAHCSKIESDPEKPLKPCSKCHTVLYCSRDCQKTGLKQHKKTCAAAAQIYAQTANLKPAAAPRVSKKDTHRGGLQKWQFDQWNT